jgi:hypothetical protein
MIRSLALLLSMAVACGGAAASRADDTKDQYLEVWNARLATYEQQFTAADADIRKDVQNLAAAIDAGRIKAWPELVQPVTAITAKVREAFVTAGRGDTLKQFIVHMQTDTTPGLTEVWFQNQSGDWQQRAQHLDRITKDFLNALDRKIAESPQWMAEAEDLAREQGFVQGISQELPSLYQQAIAYYGDVRQAEAADRERQQRFAEALAQIGRAFDNLNYQQQLQNSLNRPRTCSVWQNMITCR